MGDTSEKQQYKRKSKKRKSVLLNARKYGKKCQYGHGSQLDAESYEYMVNVLETYEKGFPTEDEKSMFANNVLETTKDNEIIYSSNQIGCRLIETLLPFADTENLNRYTKAFNDELRQNLSDRFASHVIQTLLRVCCERSLTETDEDAKENYKQFTLKVSKFLLNNIEDFIDDSCANHIIRDVFLTLAGIPKEDKNKKPEDEIKKEEKHEIPEEYEEIIKEYAKRLILWPHFKDFAFHALSSGLLQNLLLALHKINLKLFKKVVKKLIDESFAVTTESHSEKNIKDVFKCKPATFLLETATSLATPELFTQIYTNCFIGILPLLAKNKDTNFAVQKLLNSCTDKTEFEAIFDELSDHFEDIISCGNTGVISGLALACKRLVIKQAPFVQSLMKALHCIEPRDRQNHFVQTVTRLIPFERIDAAQKEKYFVNLQGSLILQTMLQFNKPIKIVNSILNMEPNDLKQFFSDSKGSHVLDAYMTSQFIGERNREKLSWRMQGTYQELAVSKNGSRSLDAIWGAANLKLRMKILDELSYKEGLWKNTPTGAIIAYKYKYDLYKKNVEQWKQAQGKEDKTKDMFADIIGEKV